MILPSQEADVERVILSDPMVDYRSFLILGMDKMKIGDADVKFVSTEKGSEIHLVLNGVFIGKAVD